MDDLDGRGTDKDIRRSWEDFLNPDVLRPRIMHAAIFIVAFDLLKSTIVDRPRQFFETGWSDVEQHPDPDYAELLARNRSPLYASLDWLKEHGAIDADDLEAFEKVKARRNHLAHELLDVLTSPAEPPAESDRTFDELVRILRKIEVWWVLNFDLPANPDFDGIDVSPDDVTPGPVAGLQVLLDVALGAPKQSLFYYEALRTRSGEADA